LYKERDEIKRAEFNKVISEIPKERIVYIDEAGVDNRIFRAYARAPRGQKIHADIPGKKRERYSMIGGLIKKKFIAPFTFKGGCNSDVFNAWLEQVLIPEIPTGSTIVMDNAAFHKSAATREIIEKSGCHLLFLPTYSPDLNPIEHCWHTLKSRLKPLISSCQVDFQQIIGNCLLTI
jgi:transposase